MIRSFMALSVLILSFSISARIITTNQPFDFMIIGQGYFSVIDGDGKIHYTRDGNFILNSEGFVMDKLGRKLHPELQMPKTTTHVDVNHLGRVHIYLKNEKEPLEKGVLALFVKDSTGRFMEVVAKEAPYDLEIKQGYHYAP